MPLEVQVVSPERVLWTGEAEMVIARTVGGGELAFLTGHAPFVGALDTARVTVRSGERGDEAIAVHGGFVEVSNNQVSILSDVAETADAIQVDRARQSRADAQEALRADATDVDAAAALRRAEVRLYVAGARD